jgi:predicted phosphodiesterase
MAEQYYPRSRKGHPACTPQQAYEAVIECDGSKSKAARLLGVTRNALMFALSKMDAELVQQSVRMAKKNQALADLNRVERKSFREHARVENAVEALLLEIRNILSTHKFPAPPKQKPLQSSCAGIVHWSDQHLNERVDLPHNRYDWQEAGRRLAKHVMACKRIFKAYGVQNVLVAYTGDLLNSDRRLDELMANAGNRAKACVLAVDLYEQALRDLHADFDVTVAGISGNESRIPKDVGWHPEVASDNYDFQIIEMLSVLLRDSGINFVPPDDPTHMVIEVAGHNVLILHGHGAVAKDVSHSIQALMGQYAARGVQIHECFWGHIHDAFVGDFGARSGGMVGANDYSEKGLGVPGRASQNCYILHQSGGFDGIKVDLQNTDGIKGYSVEKRMESYNTKSANKVKPLTSIHQVVV